LRHFTTLLFENKGIWATARVGLTTFFSSPFFSLDPKIKPDPFLSLPDFPHPFPLKGKEMHKIMAVPLLFIYKLS
jgi:hypothetical protein